MGAIRGDCVMSEEEPTPPPGADLGEEGEPSLVISSRNALRLVLALLAVWTMMSALALTFFQDASAATIGGGLKGGEGEAAQRLLGVHLFVLAPLYGLLAWDPERFRLLMWVPYVAQTGVVIVTAFDIATGDRSFQTAALPLFVSAVFLALLLFATFAGRRGVVISPDEAVQEDAAPGEESPG
jgi:hypothetical protein